MRTTSRDYARPHRPWAVRALNGVWGALGPVARVSLDPDDLVALARRKEGLQDLGAPDWREPLGRLVGELDALDRLHPLGRFIMRERIVGSLRCRLRQEALFAADPSLRERPLVAPIVITGLQRTGTTFLHRLLAADPRIRALSSWEAINPAPFRSGAPDARLRAAQQATRALAFLAPDFLAVHPIEPELPEEEVVVMDQTFLTTASEATLHVPRFAAWLEEQPQGPAYALLADVLRLLDAHDARDHWVLKTPHHLEFLDDVWAAFPDARLIHTHRDPVVTLGSFCSMVAHGQGLTSDVVDPVEIGAHWLRKTGRMVDRAMASRDAHPDRPVHDVRYDDLVADPLQSVRGIYAFLGMTLPDEVLQRIAQRQEESPAHKYGRHAYALEDFGLTRDQVAERFAPYRRRFGLGEGDR